MGCQLKCCSRCLTNFEFKIARKKRGNKKTDEEIGRNSFTCFYYFLNPHHRENEIEILHFILFFLNLLFPFLRRFVQCSTVYKTNESFSIIIKNNIVFAQKFPGNVIWVGPMTKLRKIIKPCTNHETFIRTRISIRIDSNQTNDSLYLSLSE